MDYHRSILECVGNTPLVELGHIGSDMQPTILAKVEQLNPGGSVKDRIGLSMVEAAERDGSLKPGGTIVEPTSGNTGHGLAIVAALKGYKCIFTMPDKMSSEKIQLLEAYGAEVVVCPTYVERDDPRSYYSVATHLAATIPGAFQPNQYFNPANPQSHYTSTGPEIWAQTDGAITAFVAGIGTAGTIAGTARFLKEKNPDIAVIGADPKGSIYSGPIAPYLIEGVGEDFYPGNYTADVIDRIIQVDDAQAFAMTRRLAREEGLLVGGSAGMAVYAALVAARDYGPEDIIVVLLPDTGRNYLSKLFSNEWMEMNGFLPTKNVHTVGDLLINRSSTNLPLIAIEASQPVHVALVKMSQHGFSHLPVFSSHDYTHSLPIGSVSFVSLMKGIRMGTVERSQTIASCIEPLLMTMKSTTSIEHAQDWICDNPHGVLVITEGSGTMGVVTVTELLAPGLVEALKHKTHPETQ